jgi:hypothetical protein
VVFDVNETLAEHLPLMSDTSAAVFCTYGISPRGTLVTLRTALEAKGAVVVERRRSPGANRQPTRRRSWMRCPEPCRSSRARNDVSPPSLSLPLH